MKSKELGSHKVPSHIQFDTISPATRLLEKRRKMYEVHETFEKQKQEFKKQEEAFKLQEQQIREKDLGIQEDLIRFCKFLLDNEGKRKRAEKRLEDEQKARQQKENEIKEVQKDCEILEKQNKKLQKKVDALKKYEDYLDMVTRSNPEQYTDVNEIVSFYKSLTQSHDSLLKGQKAIELEHENVKNEKSLFEKKMNQEIIQLNNEIKELQKQLEEKEQERSKLQQSVEEFTNQATTQNLNLGKILMAIDNLHTRCKMDGKQKIHYNEYEEIKAEKLEKELKEKKKGEAEKKVEKDSKVAEKGEEEDAGVKALAQLNDIKSYMSDFQSIIKNCEEQSKPKAEKKKYI